MVCKNCGSVYEKKVFRTESFIAAELKYCPLCPKEETAFQRWFKHKCDCSGDSCHEDENLEGWNAALEEVLKLEIRTHWDVCFSQPSAILPDQVKKLMEQ